MIGVVYYIIYLVPNPVNSPNISQVSSTSALVSWAPPIDPNGIIIDYNVEVEPLGFDQNPFPYFQRSRRSSADISILKCYEHLQLSPALSINVLETQKNVTNLGIIYISTQYMI